MRNNNHFQTTSTLYTSPINIAVIASGLGFFVDAFDIFLFNVYRIPSLIDLGFSGSAITHYGEQLLAIQMAGMMLGGILTGVLGDKFGRVSVLFASILLYSLANIANGFVQNIEVYSLIRFLAGVGLAGELGAGITLVSESMTKERRGLGTIAVASLGALGAVSAGLVADFVPWRISFIGAGILGLGLLLLRVKSLETTMFRKSKESNVARGSFLLLFKDSHRAMRYCACILMGVPIWYSVGMVINLTPEIAKQNSLDTVSLSMCFILFQVGIAIGDISSGIMSQWLQTRKWVIAGFMVIALAATILHFVLLIHGYNSMQVTSALMGLGCGYLSVFVTTTAEHFGTNLRVLTTATVTNFMRGAVTLLIPLRVWIEHNAGLTLTDSLISVGIVVWIGALVSVLILPETFHRSVDYIEH